MVANLYVVLNKIASRAWDGELNAPAVLAMSASNGFAEIILDDNAPLIVLNRIRSFLDSRNIKYSEEQI